MAKIEWIEYTEAAEPDPPPECAVGGWRGHDWRLAIKEGQPTLWFIGECQACQLGLESFDLEDWEMQPIPVTLDVLVEGDGFEVHAVILEITPNLEDGA